MAMTEYIKREDVLKILSGKNAPWNGYQKCKDLPAEDVVSIVRCKDCIHHPVMDGDCVAPPEIDGFLDYKCPYLVDDFWYCIMPADNWFCHRGERESNGRIHRARNSIT